MVKPVQSDRLLQVIDALLNVVGPTERVAAREPGNQTKRGEPMPAPRMAASVDRCA